MTEKQTEILRHATGDGGGKRNNYYTSDGNTDCEALVASGHMTRGPAPYEEGLRYYYATEAGKRVARGALRAERDAEGLRLWETTTTWWGHVEVESVWAKSRGAARYDRALMLSEVSDFPMLDLLRAVKVRRAP